MSVHSGHHGSHRGSQLHLCAACMANRYSAAIVLTCALRTTVGDYVRLQGGG